MAAGRIGRARPNPGHLALARFEARLPAFTLLTQNVDGLHRDAGSRNLVELHGNIWRARCSAEPWRIVDERAEPVPAVEDDGAASARALPGGADAPRRPDVPRSPACGAWLRPMSSGSGRPWTPPRWNARSTPFGIATCCSWWAPRPSSTRWQGCRPWRGTGRRRSSEVNVEDTPLTAQADVVLRGRSGVVLPEVERQL